LTFSNGINVEDKKRGGSNNNDNDSDNNVSGGDKIIIIMMMMMMVHDSKDAEKHEHRASPGNALISMMPYRPLPFSITTSIPNNDIPSSFLKVETIRCTFAESGLGVNTVLSLGSSTVRLDVESGLEISWLLKKMVS
jgi:hypothetical protein